MKPVVFLHGWAQSKQIWFQQTETFADAQFINLPGHGGEADLPASEWMAAIAEQLPQEPCLLVGWSLGGMLAMQLAESYPERLAGLALVSTTPRFRKTEQWPHGSSDVVFDGFRQAVESGSPKTLGRFFTLMLHGDELERSVYNRLAKAAVDRENRVSENGLKGGMELLQQLDLRDSVAGIKHPVLVMHGESDAVVPAAAGGWLAKTLPGAQKVMIPVCGHAPFLTQAEIFNHTLQTWRQQL
ncbi:MAG: response regulator [Zetaproteobacteria bacterium CG_4_9_14_3_um_filter_53_7]|nr:MAG: response regulator [Zetaproteobacteria bacterium CG_4_9_14_3_um_filter_53_7]